MKLALAPMVGLISSLGVMSIAAGCGGGEIARSGESGKEVASAALSAGTRLVFGLPSFEWSHEGAPPELERYHVWLEGDYWAQTFAATGLGSATQMALTLFVDGNSIPRDRLDLRVVLNGTTVGALTILPDTLGSRSYDVRFDAISGPDYRVELIATHGVDQQAGCASIGIDGSSFLILR